MGFATDETGAVYLTDRWEDLANSSYMIDGEVLELDELRDFVGSFKQDFPLFNEKEKIMADHPGYVGPGLKRASISGWR